jgi:hypothetical protein
MGIADYFRPKYRHSDVRVRTEAVRALGSDDASLLIQIARTDSDVGVRRLALERIEEASVLAELREAQSERSLKDFAGERAAELWQTVACGADADAAGNALAGILKLGQQDALVEVVAMAELAAIKKRAFAELRDPKALAALAKSDAAQDLRVAAVTRIDDPEVLRALAIDTTQKEVGLAAVEKLDDIERLEQIAHKAKNKAVRAKAQKIVAEIKEAERARKASPVSDEVKRKRAERAQLVREVEAVADSFDFARVAEVVTRSQAAWDALGTDEEAAGSGIDRFGTAVARFWRRKEVHEQTARSADELRAIQREAERERAAGEPRKPEPRAAEAREREPDDYVREPESDEKREAREAEAKALRESRERQRAEDDARREAQAAERAARQKEDAERAVAIAESLRALCADMEQLETGNDARAIDRVLGQAARSFDNIGKVAAADRDAIAERYRAVRGKLVTKLGEMREAEDWQRWANVPKAEALIETAKQMAAAEATPDLGNRLRGLQALWKEVGPMPQRRSKELWDTFKVACDAVYDKVKGVRVVEHEKFAEVAKVKEALIAEAEALAESTDWAATAEKLKGLQGRWKQSGHLPRKQGDELWNKFRAACDKFFERRKPLLEAQHQEHAANLARKHGLIARAQAVVDGAPGHGGWGKAIGTIKDLQAEWKEIGHVPRRDADAVYRAFRAACDALFAKRDAARDAEANAHHAALDELRAEIAAVRNADVGEVVPRVLALRVKAAEHDALGAEVNELVRHVITAFPEAVAGTELDPAQLRARREKLIAKADDLLPKQPVPAAAPVGDVAAQLKAAMRQNAFGDLRFSGRDPIEVLDELRAQWTDIGPILTDEDHAQAERFEAAINRVLEANGRPPRAGDEGHERRRRRDQASDGVAAVSVHDAVTTPSRVHEPLPPPPERAKSTTAVPVPDEMDGGWDDIEGDPSGPAAPEPQSSPSAIELAGDGDTDDGLDNVD